MQITGGKVKHMGYQRIRALAISTIHQIQVLVVLRWSFACEQQNTTGTCFTYLDSELSLRNFTTNCK